MKYFPHIVAIFLTVCLTNGQTSDSSKLPEKLSRLQANYNTAVERVTTPLKKTYATELRRLKIEYTKAGNLEAALAVDVEINNLEAKDGETKSKDTCVFIGTTWGTSNNVNIVKFRSNGRFSEKDVNSRPLTGTWVVVSDTEVRVNRSDKTTWNFYILPDGSITRRGYEGIVWRSRKSKKQTK